MPKIIQIQLTPTEQRKLEQIRSITKDIHIWKRATVILMSYQGISAKEITRTIGISHESVTTYRQRWLSKKFAVLKDAPRSGRPPLANASYRHRLIKTVKTPPQKLGYAFTVWSAQRLAVYLGQQTGIWLSPIRIRQLLKEAKFSYARPRYTLKNKRHPLAYQRARKRLQILKKRA